MYLTVCTIQKAKKNFRRDQKRISTKNNNSKEKKNFQRLTAGQKCFNEWKNKTINHHYSNRRGISYDTMIPLSIGVLFSYWDRIIYVKEFFNYKVEDRYSNKTHRKQYVVTDTWKIWLIKKILTLSQLRKMKQFINLGNKYRLLLNTKQKILQINQPYKTNIY